MAHVNAYDLDFLLGLVCRDHGHRAVRFALGVNDDANLADVDWTRGRQEALQFLLGGVMISDLRQQGVLRGAGSTILGYSPGLNDSALRGLRMHSGAQVPSLDAGVQSSANEAVQLLQRIVNRYELDVQVLLRDEAQGPGRWVPSMYRDPDGEALVRLLLEHEATTALREALASSEAEVGGRACTIVAPGHSGPFLERLIPEHLVSACVTRTLVAGRAPTAAALRGQAEVVISDFLSLMSGHPVGVPAAVGAVGSHLVVPEGGGGNDAALHVPVGDGYLRPVTSLDGRLFSMAADSVGLVWVTNERTQVRFLPPGPGAPNDDDPVLAIWAEMREGRIRLEDRWDIIAQAVVLAAPGYPSPAWVISDFFVTSVVSSHEMSSSRRGFAVGESSKVTVSTDEFGDVPQWRRLLATHPEVLAVTRRRVVSALSSRPDPFDALVDAVVAWEGIFSGASETQMRTVLPSCRLLASEENAAACLSAMKKAYGLRSKLVHGSSRKVPNSDIRDARDDVLKWVIGMLRILYRDRPELLELGAPERSEAVLVPGSRPVGGP